MTTAPAPNYEDRVQNQVDQFRHPEVLKKLPPIYKYWTQKHLAPIVNEIFGTRNFFIMYAGQFGDAMARQDRSRRILSIGAGDCKAEVAIAKKLVEMQVRDFVIDCTDLSGVRLERGREHAASEGVAEYLEFLEVDLNSWDTDRKYAGVMAHHTLHHIVELEKLFARIQDLMVPEGVFVSIDMIGRNGHMRWPESLEWVERLWGFLPEKYKFNHQFGRTIDPYMNWDCSKKGFEGIRAQDILPLLVENFSFTHFVAVGGIVDIFVERGYGHNYDPDVPTDTAFIDFTNELNVTLIDHGVIKPTMLFSVMRGKQADIATRCHRHWTPEFCIRKV